MGIKRIVDTSFWTDGNVDDFSPEDKYFMLYLLTNPFSTQLGIYEISIKQVAFQLGYSVDAVNVLLDRFESKYGVIFYSKDTKEVAIKNYLRHSIVKGGKPVEDCIKKEISKVKCKSLVYQVFKHIAPKDDLNETVRKIVSEYENEYDNDNDNDNDVSYHDSYNDSSSEPIPHVKRTDYQKIIDMFHNLCPSYSTIKKISDARKKAIKARLNAYSIEDFETLFKKAEASDFLKGANDRNWQATFDWLIKDANMAKVLDGNYDNKKKQPVTKRNAFNNAPQRTYDIAAMEGMLLRAQNPAPTVDDDAGLKAEADELQRMLQEKYAKSV